MVAVNVGALQHAQEVEACIGLAGDVANMVVPCKFAVYNNAE